MSIKLMSLIFDMKMEDLETDRGEVVSASSAAFVLLALADYANNDGESVYPGISRIEQKTKLSRPTVTKALHALELAGYIEKVGISKRGTNEYKIVVKSLYQKEEEVVKPLYQGSKATLLNPSVNHQLPVNANALSDLSQNDVSSAEEQEGNLDYLPCDEDGLMVKKKQKRAKGEVYAIAQALAEVCGMSFEANRGRLLREAGNLAQDKRISPLLIRSLYCAGGAWYAQDWRGRRGQKPTPDQVTKTIFSFRVKVLPDERTTSEPHCPPTSWYQRSGDYRQ